MRNLSSGKHMRLNATYLGLGRDSMWDTHLKGKIDKPKIMHWKDTVQELICIIHIDIYFVDLTWLTWFPSYLGDMGLRPMISTGHDSASYSLAHSRSSLLSQTPLFAHPYWLMTSGAKNWTGIHIAWDGKTMVMNRGQRDLLIKDEPWPKRSWVSASPLSSLPLCVDLSLRPSG